MLDDIGKAVAIVVGILTAAKLLKDLNKDNDNDKKNIDCGSYGSL